MISVEAERVLDLQRQFERGQVCYCDAYPFPHKTSGPRFCHTNPKVIAGVEPDEDEIHYYEACMLTPRSA